MKFRFLIVLLFCTACESGYENASLSQKIEVIQKNVLFLSSKYNCLKPSEKYNCTELGSIMLINPKYSVIVLNSNPDLIYYIELFYSVILQDNSSGFP